MFRTGSTASGSTPASTNEESEHDRPLFVLEERQGQVQCWMTQYCVQIRRRHGDVVVDGTGPQPVHSPLPTIYVLLDILIIPIIFESSFG